MKAYVIKNNEGLYYTTHLNYEDIHTEDISEASIYDRKIANDIKLFLDKTTCQYGEKWEVVEITIAEGNLEQELAEKDKVLTIYKRALELACREIVYDCGSWKIIIEDEMQGYLDQAKKELEE